MDFSINRKRSEFVKRYEDETLGRSKKFLDALLAFSSPGMPMCPGLPNERDRGGCDWRRR